jgi:dTDP-4-dehydrorhamnose reductase
MQRILVTGGKGMLGTAIAERFPRDEAKLLLLDLPEFDVTEPEAVGDRIGTSRPDLVIHCAAMTDVDGCETNPDAAFRVNSLGTENVAAGCAAAGCPLVHISTDFVFDGRKTTPYTEDDAPAPISVYGSSKLRAEEAVRRRLPRHFIVRTAWSFAPWGRNFVRTILRLARERGELRVVDDQVGSPTYTPDLADGLWRLSRSQAFGTYHMTNGGVVSRHWFAREILSLAGMGEVPIAPIASDDLDQPARRPAYSALASDRLQKIGVPPLRPYQEALTECVERLREQDQGEAE